MPQDSRRRREPARWYLDRLAAAACAGIGVLGVLHAFDAGLGFDSHAYWSAARRSDGLYDAAPLARDAYLYSPLFAQLTSPLALLPWPVFAALWTAASAAAFVWLLQGLPTRWLVCGLVACLPEMLAGNIYAFMAVALVLGCTRGYPWLLPGLTKIVPGFVGVIWLVARRQWRELSTAAGLVLAAVSASAAVAPDAWVAWFVFLTTTSPEASRVVPPYVSALVLLSAVVSVLVAARTHRYWLLAVATILMSPTFGLNTLTLLAAVPRLLRRGRADRGDCPTALSGSGPVRGADDPSAQGPAGAGDAGTARR